MLRTNLKVALCTLMAGTSLSACTVGPNFEKPTAPAVARYTAEPLVVAGNTGDDAQSFIEGRDVPGDWWTLFHSEPLNALIVRSLAANPDLKAAQAALKAAHENMLAQRGVAMPHVSLGVAASRSRTSAQLSPTPDSGDLYYSLFTPQVSVSYVPDVFGMNRRSVEALQAQEDHARFELIAAHIALSANVVAAAIQEAALRAQIDATHQLIDLNSHSLEIMRNQVAKGYTGRLDLAAQEAQVAQIKATLPPLLKQLGQQRDLLAVLSGGFPSDPLPETFTLASLVLPRELPLSVPAKLVAQRPDIRQAEETLHAASAQIGIAVANRLPNFEITADAGAMSLALGNLFAGGSGFWTLAAGATQPVFQGGTLLHQERAARAVYTQAAEQYRAAVLTAFQNVADTLIALQQDTDALKSATEAKDAAATTLQLAESQFNAGYAGYLPLLAAQQAYQQAVMTQVQAQALRFSDTAALFQALGGGWWRNAGLTNLSDARVRQPQ